MSSRSEDENKTKNPLLCVNLTSFALVGLWPFQTQKFLNNKPLRFFHFTLGLIAFVLHGFAVLFELCDLYQVWGDLEDVVSNISITCITSCAAIKAFSFYCNMKKLKSLVDHVSKVEMDIVENQRMTVKKIFQDYVKFARKLTYSYWTLTFGTVFVFCIIPLLEYRFSSDYHMIFDNGTEYWSYRRPMILNARYPFDKFVFSTFLTVYGFEICVSIVSGAYHGFWDMLVVSIMIHLIGQLKILRRNVIDMTQDDTFASVESNEMNSDVHKAILNDVRHKKLVQCVNLYKYIFSFTKDFNTMISPVMMLYFIICISLLCTIGFQVTLYGLSLRLGLLVEYFVAMMIQLFMFYWHGNELLEEKERLLMATYSCEWYNQDKRFKTNLLILREGLKLPLEFKVGPFYTMSLNTFLGILRGSYSYFAVLRSLQDNKLT